jgi:hypothetical protein
MELIGNIVFKHIENLRIYYDKSIFDEEHWIYKSLEDMILNDENYEENDIKLFKSKYTLKVLKFLNNH